MGCCHWAVLKQPYCRVFTAISNGLCCWSYFSFLHGGFCLHLDPLTHHFCSLQEYDETFKSYCAPLPLLAHY